MNAHTFSIDGHRQDHLIIQSMIKPDTHVLDIGCGDGALLELLRETKNIDGRGIEISQKNVNQSVAKGLSVIQGTRIKTCPTILIIVLITRFLA